MEMILQNTQVTIYLLILFFINLLGLIYVLFKYDLKFHEKLVYIFIIFLIPLIGLIISIYHINISRKKIFK